MLYVIGQIYTSTIHASASFFAIQSSVRSDVTDYRAISPAYRSAILKCDGLAVSNHVLCRCAS